MAAWVPHPALDPSLIPSVQKFVNGIPPAHLEPPRDGEQFEVPEEAIERLQDYAFSQGFVVVTGSCGSRGNPRKYYHCIHHQTESQNNRKLDEHKGTAEAPTNRQRELTHIRALGCKWRLSISYKRIDRKFEEPKAWIFCVQEGQQTHSHPLQANPFSYEAHRLRSPDYNKALEIAKTHRPTLTYGQSDRVLADTERDFDEVLHIDRKKYYNLIPSVTRNQREILLGFLAVLEEFEDMVTRTRYEYERDANGVPIKRILKQISWMDTQQRTWARRFCSDFLIEFDATFNTNALKMLLFVSIGVTNTNMTFPVAFSFALAESELATTAFLTFLKEEVWIQNTNSPRVALVDQGKGMLASLNVVMPGLQRQLCQFHACENIRAKATLLAALKPDEREYFEDNWAPKEHIVVSCYVALLPNLGAHTTQRNEAMHPVIKAILNGQVSLETAFRNIRSELRRMHRLIREKEEESRTKRPRGVDFLAFQLLIGRVTIWAMEKINPEWVAAVAMAERITSGEEEVISGPCNCTLVVRFGLPCRHAHYLLRAALESFPIPVTLLHPRWRLDGPETGIGDWQPRYYDDAMNPDLANEDISHNKDKNRFVRSTANQQALYDRLPKEARDVLTNQVETFTNNVTSTHEALAKVKAGIPVELPKPPPTKKELWVLKKHDKAARRAATAAEVAEKEARKHDLANKPPSSSAPPAVTAVFRAPPTIFVPEPSFNPSASTAPPSNPPPKKKGGRPKGRKNDPKPQPLLPPTNPPPPPPPREPTPPPKATRTRKVIEPKKWEPEPHQRKSRRQRGSTIENTAEEPARKKSKTGLRDVQAEEVEDRESQQKRIVNSAFIVD